MDQHSGIAPLNPLVIVVDDDAAVRNSLKFSLEIDGFAVRTYGSADELVRTGDLVTVSASSSIKICRTRLDPNLSPPCERRAPKYQ